MSCLSVRGVGAAPRSLFINLRKRSMLMGGGIKQASSRVEASILLKRSNRQGNNCFFLGLNYPFVVVVCLLVCRNAHLGGENRTAHAPSHWGKPR